MKSPDDETRVERVRRLTGFEATVAAIGEQTTTTGVVSNAQPDTGLEAGDVVAHFEIAHKLGEGGMGAVYLAHDRKLRRRVALKMIGAGHFETPRAVSAFLDEARTTAAFNHPNIVTVYEVGEHEGQPFVALEYVDGETLSAALSRGPMRLDESLAVAHAVALALTEAHEHGVLHRDLKPANVMLGKRVRVVDFGLAKRLGGAPLSSPRAHHDDTWAGAGTPAYMSPEQWRDEPASAAADVWAFGILLYELCACRRPYDQATLLEHRAAVCSDDPVPRLDALTAVPPALAALVTRCLDKNAGERPSFKQITAELEQLRTAPLPKKNRRRIALAAGIAAVALAWTFTPRSSEPLTSLGLVAPSFTAPEPAVSKPLAASPAASASSTSKPTRASQNDGRLDQSEAEAQARFFLNEKAKFAGRPCGGLIDESRTYMVTVVVANDGRILSATPTPADVAGKCVARTIGNAALASRFKGPPITVSVAVPVVGRLP